MLLPDSGDALDYTLVLPEEADVSEGYMSILSPLGTAMLGFRRGEAESRDRSPRMNDIR